MCFSGCEKSIEAYKIYVECEQNNTFIATIVFTNVIVTLITLFLIVPFLPISYLLIGFPKPELWILPFATQLVTFIEFYLNF